MADTNLQMPIFFKQDPSNPNNQTVVDQNGTPITIDQYKQITSQLNVPNAQLNWSYVDTADSYSQYQAKQSLSKLGFSDADIAKIPPSQVVAWAGTADVFSKQFEQGPVASEAITDQGITQAMATAAQDPSIVQKYGDEITTAAPALSQTISNLKQGYSITQTEQQIKAAQAKQQLEAQVSSAGQAYSGIGERARQQLNTQEEDIVQSNRATMQQNTTKAIQDYEARYGSSGLSALNLQNQLPSDIALQPIGGITGSYGTEKQSAIDTKAQTLYSDIAPSTTVKTS
jgi:hypothetical protein